MRRVRRMEKKSHLARAKADGYDIRDGLYRGTDVRIAQYVVPQRE